MREKTDNVWEVIPTSSSDSKELSDRLGVSQLTAKLLINRGMRTVEEAERFINVSMDHLYPPMAMSGMREAVERVCRAVADGEKIAVYGDYDVDGISATSLLILFFRDIGIAASYYIPNRIDEGYGLNEEAIKKLAGESDLIITVDCGVSSIHEVSLARQLGLDIIITDHHQVSSGLPPACAILNPSRGDCGYPFKCLAGVGIAFKLVMAVHAALLERKIINRSEAPKLKKYLDLVALGTLADMVPLVGENHTLVRIGLKELTTTKKVGLRALKNLGNFGDRRINSTDVNFFLSPRLNAIGRLKSASLGVELLTTNNRIRAREIARLLEEENANRQKIQNRILHEVLEQIRDRVDIKNDKAIVLASKGWHPGVIGIVAAKVVDRFHMPTILLNMEDGVSRGSARSVPDFHIYNGLKLCEDKLLHFGGHKYAAGLSLKTEMIDEFRHDFQKAVERQVPSGISKPTLEIDSEARLAAFNTDTVEDIMELGPFGTANRQPLFLAKNISFTGKPSFVGKEGEHVTFEVESGGGALDGIGFGMSHSFKQMDVTSGRYDIVFTPYISARSSMSRQVQLRLRDFRPAV
ncbi:MAG: single-stranded-DNA-specific exonuclease RecJ [Nitrospinota bacterium]